MDFGNAFKVFMYCQFLSFSRGVGEKNKELGFFIIYVTLMTQNETQVIFILAQRTE